jgi:hypothetical protein
MQLLTTNFSDARLVSADQYVSSPELAGIIEACALLSMDARVKPAEQGNFLALSLALRDQLRVLVAKIFTGNTTEVQAANKQLKTVNQQMKATLDEINKAAKTIEMLGELVSQLSKLVKIAGVLM